MRKLRLQEAFTDETPQAQANRAGSSGLGAPVIDKKLADALAQRHPWWSSRREFWQKCIDLYEACSLGRYIHRHSRESKESHAARAKRIVYRNYVSAVVGLYAHYIFSKDVTRSPIDRELEAELRRADDPAEDPQALAAAQPGDPGVQAEPGAKGEKQEPQAQPPPPRRDPRRVVSMNERLNEEWQREFLNDVDRNGTPMDRFMSIVGELAGLFDKMYVLVDMPRLPIGPDGQRRGPRSELERTEMGMRPYLTFYSPLDLVDFELDEDGKPLWVRFMEAPANTTGAFEKREDRVRKSISSTYGMDMNVPTPAQERRGTKGGEGPVQYRTWTRTGWAIHWVDGDRVIEMGSGRHPLREVPVVSVYCKRGVRFPFGGQSRVSDIITLAQEILNLDSLISEAIYHQTLAILVMSRQAQQAKEIVVSENSVLEVSPNGIPPYYLVPSQAPITFMEQRIGILAADIFRLSKFGGGFGLEPKALAPTTAAYEFNLTNRALADQAAHLEAAELEIHRLWFKWMGAQFGGYVEYPRDFSIQSFIEDLQIVTSAKQAIRSPTLRKELEKKIAKRILSSHDEAVIKRIEDEINVIPEEAIGFGPPIWFDPLQQKTSQGSGEPVGALADAMAAMGAEPAEVHAAEQQNAMAGSQPPADPAAEEAQQTEQKLGQELQKAKIGTEKTKAKAMLMKAKQKPPAAGGKPAPKGKPRP